MKALLLVVALLGVTACAARVPARVAEPADLVDALARGTRLLDEGCYACLQEAHALFKANALRSENARREAFVTAALLALREKEIGLPADRWISAATELSTPAENAYLDILAAVPWDSAGVPDYPTPLGLYGPAALARWRAFVGASSLNARLDEYLRYTFTCRRT